MINQITQVNSHPFQGIAGRDKQPPLLAKRYLKSSCLDRRFIPCVVKTTEAGINENISKPHDIVRPSLRHCCALEFFIG
jgi:hypothetical protein